MERFSDLMERLPEEVWLGLRSRDHGTYHGAAVAFMRELMAAPGSLDTLQVLKIKTEGCGTIVYPLTPGGLSGLLEHVEAELRENQREADPLPLEESEAVLSITRACMSRNHWEALAEGGC